MDLVLNICRPSNYARVCVMPINHHSGYPLCWLLLLLVVVVVVCVGA